MIEHRCAADENATKKAFDQLRTNKLQLSTIMTCNVCLVSIRKKYHCFDALYNACAAGHKAGAGLLPDQQPHTRPHRKLSELSAEKPQEHGSIDHNRWEAMRWRWN